MSSSPQIKNVSLDAQLADALQFADRFNTKIVGVLVVPGKSRYVTLFNRAAETIDGLHLTGVGIDLARKVGVEAIMERINAGEVLDGVQTVFVYAKLLVLVEAKAFNVLFFLNRSRLGRKAALSITVADLCAENGVKLFDMESPPSTLDVKVSHDEQLIGAVKSVGFERDIRDLIDKTKKGIVRRVERGYFPNKPPWGYTRIFDIRGNVTGYHLDPEVKEIILVFVDLYLGGMGNMHIAAELNRLGMKAPTAGAWNHEKVRGLILKAWAYAGYGEINRQSTSGRQYFRSKGIWEPIITPEIARRILAEQKSRDKSAKSVSHTKLFSRCVYCAECEKMMTGKAATWVSGRHNNEKRHRIQYRCHTHGLISEKKIRRAFLAYLKKFDDDAFRNDIADQPDTNDGINLANRIALLQREAEKRNAAVLKADDDYYIHGHLDETRHRTIVSAAKKQAEQLQAEITALEDRLSQIAYDSQRGERIEEIRLHGMEHFNNPVVQRANAWLRHNFRIYVERHEVKAIVVV